MCAPKLCAKLQKTAVPKGFKIYCIVKDFILQLGPLGVIPVYPGFYYLMNLSCHSLVRPFSVLLFKKKNRSTIFLKNLFYICKTWYFVPVCFADKNNVVVL